MTGRHAPHIDTNDKWLEMEKIILAVANRHCPNKEHKRKKYVPTWLNQEILESLKARDDLYKLANRSKAKLDWNIARKARNNCVKIVNAAKYNNILDLLHKEEKSSKKFWKVIKKVLPNSDSINQEVHLHDQASGLEIQPNEVPNQRCNICNICNIL